MNTFSNTLLALIAIPFIAFPAKKAKYTNFVVILMDDMGNGDLGVTGAMGYQTPHLDNMARKGMTFSHFYVAQAVSGASRAGLLTGCYPNRIGLSGAPDHTAKHGINSDEMTIAELLKQKGYRSAAFGKWHLGHLTPFLPTNNGFDEYYGIPYSNDMWPNHPTGGNYYPDLPLYENDKVVATNPDQSRFTTDFTQRSVSFIKKNKKNPFFLYLAHPMPHVPLFVSEKFKGKSQQGLYGDVMMELDWSVGEIMRTLKEEGLDENTLVIVTSDNGPWLNYGNHAGNTGGLREGKGTSFEGGHRVPCIMQWKGTIPDGKVCNKFTSTIDLFTTFASIADAALPAHPIDGVDLLPLLMGDFSVSPRNSFYYYYRRNSLEAVTDGEFKLVFPHKYRHYEGALPGDNGYPGDVEEFYPLKETLLFDLRRDPGERTNVINLYPERVEKLQKMAQEAREDLGDDLQNVQGKGVRPVGKVY